MHAVTSARLAVWGLCLPHTDCDSRQSVMVVDGNGKVEGILAAETVDKVGELMYTRKGIVSATSCLLPRVCYLVPATSCLLPRVCYLVSATSCLLTRVCYHCGRGVESEWGPHRLPGHLAIVVECSQTFRYLYMEACHV